ncbi:MAG TPA: response regulator transcription factor [Baekduia sp.]|nr:response regulator transcription factor [Baekduia sp.]
MRVVIVAPGALAAETLQSSLRTVPPLDTVGYADSRRLVAADVAAARPELIVIDGRRPDELILACVESLRQAVRRAKIIMITADADEDWLGEACDNGLDAAVSVTVGSPMLGSLVRHIALGTVYHRFAPASSARTRVIDRPFSMLTAREMEILRLVASGASNGQVAATLWVTEQTVKFHLSNVYRKLQVANRTEASHYAHVNGLLDEVAPVSVLQPAGAVAA